MLLFLKYTTTLGMLAALAWFALTLDFAAVMLGILCLSGFMITLLPVAPDKQH